MFVWLARAIYAARMLILLLRSTGRWRTHICAYICETLSCIHGSYLVGISAKENIAPLLVHWPLACLLRYLIQRHQRCAVLALQPAKAGRTKNHVLGNTNAWKHTQLGASLLAEKWRCAGCAGLTHVCSAVFCSTMSRGDSPDDISLCKFAGKISVSISSLHSTIVNF